VSNPITNIGRSKIAKSALQHRDLRGALAPNNTINNGLKNTVNNNDTEQQDTMFYKPLQIPVVMLQSTENSLINASNVDNFLIGRNSSHLWSHMLNVHNKNTASQQPHNAGEPWVGKLSSGPNDYCKCSTLGKSGVRMLLDSLRDPSGAFVMWARTGHAIQQECKSAVLDFFDILACPTDEYVGFDNKNNNNIDSNNTKILRLKQSLRFADSQVEFEEEIKKDPLDVLMSSKVKIPKIGVLFELDSTDKNSSNNNTKDNDDNVESEAQNKSIHNDEEKEEKKENIIFQLESDDNEEKYFVDKSINNNSDNDYDNTQEISQNKKKIKNNRSKNNKL